jgi:hypothetical protein
MGAGRGRGKLGSVTWTLFGKWLRRYSKGRCGAIWKLELQDRGAPHFHLLIFGLRYLPAALLARRWYEIVGSGDVNHLSAGTSVLGAFASG